MPANGAMGDQFGRAVDTRSGTVVVGAPQAEVNGKPGAGAAYVYERTPSGTHRSD
ncbi:MAG: hypothetical protein H0T85_01855 [Geodermatophilaceae bacterium]|nr:hypothetical protein [Geodermatophilaceae bacterium]